MVCFSIDIMEKQPISFQKQKNPMLDRATAHA